jgi:hypothetical protein
MGHVALTNRPGWFDPDKAAKFEEAAWWNGSNHVSKATGSQWDHEALYLTAKGSWVLNHWSQYQGSVETYESISAEAAVEWLIKNDYTAEDLPESVRDMYSEHEV